MAKNIRGGGTLVWMLSIITALSIAGAVAWWRLSQTGGVVAYFKVVRVGTSFVTEPPLMSDEQFRHVKNNHKTLIVSPLVLDAAIKKQNIASLEVVRRHGREAPQWLRGALQVTFPDDGEVMKVRLSTSQNESEQAKMILDSLVESYSQKVLFDERLSDAALQDDLGECTREFAKGLTADLAHLQERQSSASTPAEKAEATVLAANCDAKLELLKVLKLKELTHQVEQAIDENAERRGTRADKVILIQSATWVDE